MYRTDVMANERVFVVILLLQLSICVLCQSVVDSSVCEKKGKHCPESSDASYETKCCLENNGGSQFLTCCNPIVGVYIGLGVSLPIILCVIVSLVILYCCWVYRGKRKSRRMAATELTQQYQTSRQDEQVGEAPPAYTPTAEGEASNLPMYTPEDPFHTPPVANEPAQLSPDRESSHEESQLLLSEQ